MDVTKYPLDFDALGKGSTIPQSKIEEILGLKADDPGYWKGLLSLRDRIVKELEHRKLEVTVKQDNGDLVILTDSESSIYNYAWAGRHLSGYMRSHNRLLAVDVKNLSIPETAEHRKRVEVSSKYAQSLTQTTRTIHASRDRDSLPLPVLEPKRRIVDF
jgi:hypothetical protein